MTLRPVEPWEKRPGETGRAHEAFRAYRDAGPTRTLAAVTDAHGSTVQRWATRHDWRERAEAWDAELHRVEDARRLDAIRTMDDVHQRAARAMIQTALRSLADVGQLTPHQAARFLDLGTRLERATLLGEHLAPVPVTDADDDDLALTPLERIARELAGTA